MQPSATSLRDRSVCDLARERVLDRELAVLARRGGAHGDDEVALLEHAEVRLVASEQVHDRSRREDPSHHGTRLERRLLARGKPVDPRGEHRVNGVGHREVRSRGVRPPIRPPTGRARRCRRARRRAPRGRTGSRPRARPAGRAAPPAARGSFSSSSCATRVAGQRVEPEDGRVALARFPTSAGRPESPAAPWRRA